jgi:hypothetical protein
MLSRSVPLCSHAAAPNALSSAALRSPSRSVKDRREWLPMSGARPRGTLAARPLDRLLRAKASSIGAGARRQGCSWFVKPGVSSSRLGPFRRSARLARARLASVAGGRRTRRTIRRARRRRLPSAQGRRPRPGQRRSAGSSAAMRSSEASSGRSGEVRGLPAISWVGTCEMSVVGCRLKAHVRVRPDAAGG